MSDRRPMTSGTTVECPVPGHGWHDDDGEGCPLCTQGAATPLIEIKPRRWVDEHGQRNAADFYPYVNGEPDPSLATCTKCRHYTVDEFEGPVDCAPSRDPSKAETCYPFCGPICGEFRL